MSRVGPCFTGTVKISPWASITARKPVGETDAPSVVRRVQPGAAADLCVLHCPLGAALADPNAEAVRATVIAGTVVHDANG